jgi:hypothetical protein
MNKAEVQFLKEIDLKTGIYFQTDSHMWLAQELVLKNSN